MAQPYRRLGSFLSGDGVGGTSIYWNGKTWRPMEVEFRLESYVEETFGAQTIPDGMTIQDWGVSYDELAPFFDRFEYMAEIAGKVGNPKGEILAGGILLRHRAAATTRCR